MCKLFVLLSRVNVARSNEDVRYALLMLLMSRYVFYNVFTQSVERFGFVVTSFLFSRITIAAKLRSLTIFRQDEPSGYTSGHRHESC